MTTHRRDALKALGTASVAASLPLRFASAAAPKLARMPAEGKDTPKICLGFYDPVDEASMRRRKEGVGSRTRSGVRSMRKGWARSHSGAPANPGSPSPA